MKKVVLLMLSLFLLGGCASEADLSNQVLTLLQEKSMLEPFNDTNMSKKYFSYYLPRDVGRGTGNSLSGVYLKDGYKFVMNLDASQIIIDEYYTEAPAEPVSEVQMETSPAGMVYQGSYINTAEETKNYTLRLEKLTDGYYYIDLAASELRFYSIVPYAEIKSLLNCMLTIMQSVKVERQLILNDFSLKSATAQQQQNLDYLNEEVSVDGYIKDLVEK